MGALCDAATRLDAAAGGAADIYRELERPLAPILVDRVAHVLKRAIQIADAQVDSELGEQQEARHGVFEKVATAFEAEHARPHFDVDEVEAGAFELRAERLGGRRNERG